MKYRSSFVSNSSSSSFIITNDDKKELVKKIINESEIPADYYELDGTLYTSIIYDGDCELFNRIYDLADGEVSTGHSSPYDEDEFYEFEGERGVERVWIEKFRCKDLQEIEELKAKQLMQYVKQFFEIQEIGSKDGIQYLSLADINTFIDTCFTKAGVYEISEEYNMEL